MICPKKIVRHELIGLYVKIVKCTNPTAVGKEGYVVDESRNMLVVDVKGKQKKFSKKDCTFSFKLPGGWVNVSGSLLVGRPEDRIKKKLKQW
jgi:ribonuclease P protein subunit POP4